VVTGLLKIGLALKSHAWQDASPKGLTPTQGQILTLLHSRHSSLRLTEIAEGLAVKPATASDAVVTLVEKGLVKKGKDTEDGRAISIALTKAGRIEAESVASWPDFLLAAVDELSESEQMIFFRCLIKMVRSLQEKGKIPVSRMCVNCKFFRPNVYPNSELPHHCQLVNAPFGDRHLRLDCPEHIAAEPEAANQAWQAFLSQN
jgi:DNA-binding MarR family transcriptional regulator